MPYVPLCIGTKRLQSPKFYCPPISMTFSPVITIVIKLYTGLCSRILLSHCLLIVVNLFNLIIKVIILYLYFRLDHSLVWVLHHSFSTCQCCLSIQLFWIIFSITILPTVTIASTISAGYVIILEEILLKIWGSEWHHSWYSWPSVNWLVPLDQSYYQAKPIANFVTHVMSMTAALASDVVNAALFLWMYNR